MNRSIYICSLLALFLAAPLVGCGDSNDDEENQQEEPDAGADADEFEPSVVEVSYDFERSPQGWEADVTDFPVAAESQVEFEERVRPLPDGSNIEDDTHAYYLKGKNPTDEIDIFMFIRRELTADDGVEPDTLYNINFDVTYATNYPEDCENAEAQNAYLKLGGHTWRPARKTNQSEERIEFNARKGDGSVGGDEATVAGDLAHQEPCGDVFDRYIPMTRNHTHDTPIKSSPDGTLWLIAGVDSEMSGENRIYIMDISATLTEVEE